MANFELRRTVARISPKPVWRVASLPHWCAVRRFYAPQWWSTETVGARLTGRMDIEWLLRQVVNRRRRDGG